MWPAVREWLRPESVKEACEMLRQGGDHAMAIAGATSLVWVKPPGKEIVVDLSRLGLEGIEEERGGWCLGAMVRIGRLVADNAARQWGGGVIAEAASHIASTPVRNLITVGGNAVQVYPWSDLPPLFLAVSARFKLSNAAGEREVAADDFFCRHPRKILTPGELLTRVVIPPAAERSRFFFKTFTRTAVDFALVTVAGSLKMSGRRCDEARIVLGACSPLPRRVREAEQALAEAEEMDEQVIEQAVSALRRAGGYASDYRASAEWRRQVAGVLLARALREAVGGKAKRGGR